MTRHSFDEHRVPSQAIRLLFERRQGSLRRGSMPLRRGVAPLPKWIAKRCKGAEPFRRRSRPFARGVGTSSKWIGTSCKRAQKGDGFTRRRGKINAAS